MTQKIKTWDYTRYISKPMPSTGAFDHYLTADYRWCEVPTSCPPSGRVPPRHPPDQQHKGNTSYIPNKQLARLEPAEYTVKSLQSRAGKANFVRSCVGRCVICG
jgi:hypothetical protein